MDAVITGLAQGFSVALQPINRFLVLSGCFFGTLIGALPGIGPINGVDILLPIAYSKATLADWQRQNQPTRQQPVGRWLPC